MEQLTFALAAPEPPSFENFIAGANREAVAALERAARGELDEACVVVWGPPGAGRSHLLRAVAGAERVHLRDVLADLPINLPQSPADTGFFTAAVTGYWNIFKQNLGIMVAVAQLGATQPRFAHVQNEFRRFGMDIVRASVLRAQEQGYAADLDPDHIALAISLLFENFTTVYLRPDAAALGVSSTDADAVRTLATIWQKTLYGNPAVG